MHSLETDWTFPHSLEERSLRLGIGRGALPSTAGLACSLEACWARSEELRAEGRACCAEHGCWCRHSGEEPIRIKSAKGVERLMRGMGEEFVVVGGFEVLLSQRNWLQSHLSCIIEYVLHNFVPFMH